jgi:hypothetical protein
MKNEEQPMPDDICAFKELIDGKPADQVTMRRLVTCCLIEEIDGTAILTKYGIEAAMQLV